MSKSRVDRVLPSTYVPVGSRNWGPLLSEERKQRDQTPYPKRFSTALKRQPSQAQAEAAGSAPPARRTSASDSGRPSVGQHIDIRS